MMMTTNDDDDNGDTAAGDDGDNDNAQSPLVLAVADRKLKHYSVNRLCFSCNLVVTNASARQMREAGQIKTWLLCV